MYREKENGKIQVLPYDKFLKLGAETLSDEELLAIILRTGTKGEDAVSLACHVLKLCGKKQGLLGLYHISIPQLLQISGIGLVKAVKLKAISELSRRMAMASCQDDLIFRNSSAVASYYMEKLRHLEKEHCVALFLDSKDSRIAEKTMSIGMLNSVIMSVREIIRQALLLNAASIILLHNHPSGDSTPSEEDIQITNTMKIAAEFMEVTLLDHIIIGDNTYTSLKEEGVL